MFGVILMWAMAYVRIVDDDQPHLIVAGIVDDSTQVKCIASNSHQTYHSTMDYLMAESGVTFVMNPRRTVDVIRQLPSVYG